MLVWFVYLPVTEWKLVGLGSRGQTDQLITHTNTEYWLLSVVQVLEKIYKRLDKLELEQLKVLT